jgi:hypothetical protein
MGDRPYELREALSRPAADRDHKYQKADSLRLLLAALRLTRWSRSDWKVARAQGFDSPEYGAQQLFCREIVDVSQNNQFVDR